MNAKARLRAIKELKSSEGWHILRAIMEDELLQVASSLAEKRPMNNQELDFTRGTMYAAKQALNMPDKLISVLENDVLLEEQMAKRNKPIEQDDNKSNAA